MALKLKKFTKEELLAVFVIFAVLVGVSVPNFALSLKRSRDQIRKDDLGQIKTFVNEYRSDFGSYPLSTEDGRFIACLAPGTTVKVDTYGKLIADLIPCEWGKDAIVDLTPGSTKVYSQKLPQDPHSADGVSYLYLSDGRRYQLFSSLEAIDDVEYDESVLSRGLACGTRLCNLGRGYGCEPTKTLTQCEEEYLKRLIKNE
jgi:type II secretory pathway pseudopilin PulG